MDIQARETIASGQSLWKSRLIALLVLSSFIFNGFAPRITVELADAQNICYIVVNQSILLMQFLPGITDLSVRISAGLLKFDTKSGQQAPVHQAPVGLPDTSTNYSIGILPVKVSESLSSSFEGSIPSIISGSPLFFSVVAILSSVSGPNLIFMFLLLCFMYCARGDVLNTNIPEIAFFRPASHGRPGFLFNKITLPRSVS